ncbi:MAG: imidazole glycerol phosphate synthase subunit HisH [Anaerolineae bacterium]|jgi:glutamine amidotransferase|nr:imidazole glycerol phosphate synthase subunit HisH [Anaerolineae bacterium]
MGNTTLGVIDYGAGNLRSVVHALKYLQVTDFRLITTPADLKGVTRLILPGVGAFGAGMNQLREQGLIEPIKAAVRAGMPYLGICLGMQFLFESSDEMGTFEGLGLLPGFVTRFEDLPGDLKIPHIGWNQLKPSRTSSLLDGIPDGSYAYFVHSYYCFPSDQNDVLITVEYGWPFTAAVARDHIFGVQFHPEKSQKTGLRLLQNFLNLSEKVTPS